MPKSSKTPSYSPPIGIGTDAWTKLVEQVNRQEFMLMGLSAIVTELLTQVHVLEAKEVK